MEQIDDDCAKRGIQFVKVSEEGAAEAFGVARLPSLVFFQNDLPSLYEGMHVHSTQILFPLNIFKNEGIREILASLAPP